MKINISITLTPEEESHILSILSKESTVKNAITDKKNEYDNDLSTWGFNASTWNTLRHHGIHTRDELTSLTRDDLIRLSSLGPTKLRNIEAALGSRNLTLKREY